MPPSVGKSHACAGDVDAACDVVSVALFCCCFAAATALAASAVHPFPAVMMAATHKAVTAAAAAAAAIEKGGVLVWLLKLRLLAASLCSSHLPTTLTTLLLPL